MLRLAPDALENAGSELLLDFSQTRRIDADAVKALEQLTDRAEKKQVRVTLVGAGVDVYRVLKLVKLAGRLSFRSQK